MSDVRCAACRRLFSEEGLLDLNARAGFAHHSREECVSSRSQGCSLCGFILELVLRSVHGDKWEAGKRLVFRSGSPAPGTRGTGIRLLHGGFDDTPDVITMAPFAKPGMIGYFHYDGERGHCS